MATNLDRLWERGLSSQGHLVTGMSFSQRNVQPAPSVPRASGTVTGTECEEGSSQYM